MESTESPLPDPHADGESIGIGIEEPSNPPTFVTNNQFDTRDRWQTDVAGWNTTQTAVNSLPRPSRVE